MKKLIFLVVVLLSLFGIDQAVKYYEFQQPPTKKEKRAIVIGATSGMGRQTAKLLGEHGYTVGLVGRRKKLLQSLQQELPVTAKAHIKRIDMSLADKAKKQLEKFIKKMGGLDVMVVSVSCLAETGCVDSSSQLSWEKIKKFLNTDTRGFWVGAHVAVKQFEKQKHGHLIGISSVDSLVASPRSPEYSGAKAFISKYLDGIRSRAQKNKLPIFVTEIIPGWVDVERKKYSDLPGTYWVATKEEAAKQIYQAIKAKKNYAYVTKRWQIMGILFQILPDWFVRWTGL